MNKHKVTKLQFVINTARAIIDKVSLREREEHWKGIPIEDQMKKWEEDTSRFLNNYKCQGHFKNVPAGRRKSVPLRNVKKGSLAGSLAPLWVSGGI